MRSSISPHPLSFTPLFAPFSFSKREYVYLWTRGKDFRYTVSFRLCLKSLNINRTQSISYHNLNLAFHKRDIGCYHCSSEGNGSEKLNSPLDSLAFRKWEVPWGLQTVTCTLIASGASFVLAGSVEAVATLYIHLLIPNLSLDEKPEILLASQLIATVLVLAALFETTGKFRPLPDDVFRYSFEDPFNIEDGWLLWGGIGFLAAILAVALTGIGLSLVGGENSQRESGTVVELLPFIGRSPISTACILAASAILAPLLEETLFRGFIMVSLTKWLPVPISVILTAGLFALVHFELDEFPQLFVLGNVLGFSYARTRNLLTPITIHSLWNSGVITLLTYLQAIGYDSLNVMWGQ